MKVGILTGGGDCPGLNPVIRGIVRTITNNGGTAIGLLEGWRGALTGNHIVLTPENTEDVLSKGGTMLGSSRTNPYKNPEEVQQVLATFKSLGLDCLIAIGGDDTLGVASKLYADHQFPTIGCPKTIDNDLSATDQTFGFDTCININMEAIDRLRTTAESHRRIVVIEAMGRHAGWITCYSAMATGADYCLVPEQEADMADMINVLKARREAGKKYGIVVVSEGAKLTGDDFVTKDGEIDEFGHVKLGGIGDQVAKYIEKEMDIETRCVVLGHLQRGGTPTAFDRILGTRLGINAARLALSGDFGKMVALKGTKIVPVTLADAVDQMRELDDEIYQEAMEFMKA